MENILEKNGIFSEGIKQLFFISSLKKDSTAISILNSLQKRKDLNLYVFSDIYYNCEKFILIDDLFDISDYVIRNKLKIDILFFVEGGSMQLFPLGLDKLNCIKIWYGIDTHMDYLKHLYISRIFDLTFLAQYEYIDKLKSDGINNCFWLPLAFDSNKNYDNNTILKKKIDVSYVGSLNNNLHSERIIYLEIIKNNFENIFIGPLESEKMYSLYQNSHIVFNKSINNDINMRFFEAMGCGALLFTNKIINNGIEKLFTENKHFITYENEYDLIHKIKFYLQNKDQLERISLEGKTEVTNFHTYDNRIENILNITTNFKPSKDIKFIDYLPVLNSFKMYRAFNFALYNNNDLNSLNFFRKFYYKLFYFILFQIDSILLKFKKKILG